MGGLCGQEGYARLLGVPQNRTHRSPVEMVQTGERGAGAGQEGGDRSSGHGLPAIGHPRFGVERARSSTVGVHVHGGQLRFHAHVTEFLEEERPRSHGAGSEIDDATRPAVPQEGGELP